jgi:hypothetical protein
VSRSNPLTLAHANTFSDFNFGSSVIEESWTNVSLTPELERFVDANVESGLYNNASEVVREGLRLLKEQD